jgi:hypothetical protein
VVPVILFERFDDLFVQDALERAGCDDVIEHGVCVELRPIFVGDLGRRDGVLRLAVGIGDGPEAGVHATDADDEPGKDRSERVRLFPEHCLLTGRLMEGVDRNDLFVTNAREESRLGGMQMVAHGLEGLAERFRGESRQLPAPH